MNVNETTVLKKKLIDTYVSSIIQIYKGYE